MISTESKNFQRLLAQFDVLVVPVIGTDYSHQHGGPYLWKGRAFPQKWALLNFIYIEHTRLYADLLADLPEPKRAHVNEHARGAHVHTRAALELPSGSAAVEDERRLVAVEDTEVERRRVAVEDTEVERRRVAVDELAVLKEHVAFSDSGGLRHTVERLTSLLDRAIAAINPAGIVDGAEGVADEETSLWKLANALEQIVDPSNKLVIESGLRDKLELIIKYANEELAASTEYHEAFATFGVFRHTAYPDQLRTLECELRSLKAEYQGLVYEPDKLRPRIWYMENFPGLQ
jgi:hypothetical protein